MESLASILLFCFVTTITPGPNNIMLMTSGVNHGIKKTIPHLLGIAFGFPAMVAALGSGLGVIFVSYPVVHEAIKVVGVTYMLFLAWKIANAGNVNASVSLQKPFTFLQAVAFQWVNPKAWIIAIGAIATYTTVGNVQEQVLWIILGYATVGSLCMTFWLAMGAFLQKLMRNKKHVQMFNIFMAVLLVGSIATMIIA